MPHLELKEGAKLYYEVHGEGAPFIFLNGVMMNTLSWVAYVPVLSKKFKLILVDLRDQGQSSKMAQPYELDIHVGDLLRLLDELALPKVHIMGPSYGGNVALKFALSHQNRLKTLMLPNTMSFVTNILLQIGQGWELAAELNNGEKFFKLATPVIYSPTFFQNFLDFLIQRQAMFKSMLTKEWFEAFIRLSQSAYSYYISPEQLKTITVPTLLIGAEDDIITPIEYMEILHENIKGSEFVVIPKAGHGTVIESMNEMMTMLIGFALKHS
jgi:pimeloyl-ACP methyl ester carboxylesterase